MKALIPVAFSVALIALLASTASGQQQVNMRVNLSTQPVYGGFQSRVTYFGLGNLYSTGNIRGGRAFRGNRNFLEDRYFSGSLTGFYRDTVGGSDVTGRGPTYGLGQPFYRPGSLTVSGNTVRRFIGGTAPVGFSYNPSRTLASPFQASVFQRALPRAETPTAAYPSAGAIRGLTFKLGLTSASYLTSPLVTRADGSESGNTLIPELPQPMTSEMLYGPQEGDGLDDLLPEWLRRPEPPAEPQEEAVKADWIVDLEERLQQEELARQREEALTEMRRPLLEPIDLGELYPQGDADDMEAEAILLPGVVARGRMRIRGSYAQYMELARLEMKIGAYRPAANAYRQAASYQPFDSHQATVGEAVARLLIKEYYIAAVMWQRAITGRPKAFGKEFRLKDAVAHPDQWKAIEKDLRTVLEQSPTSRDHALCLATVLVFSGQGAEAAPYLEAAESNPEAAETIRLLRQWAAP